MAIRAVEQKQVSKDEKEICLYCKWWHPFNKLDKDELNWQGDCRRNPPKTRWVGKIDFERIMLDKRPDWPMTYGQNFCGEFKERPSDV